MSAQPSDQIGGTTPKPSLLHSLRGSFSQGSGGVVPAPVAPAPSVTPPEPPVAPIPVAPPEPAVELEQVAEQVEATTEVSPQAISSEEPAVVTEQTFEEAPPAEIPAETLAEVAPANVDAMASAVPMAVDEMTDSLNPPVAGGGTAKEAPLLNVTVEHPAVDQAGGVQYVETEKIPEMPPEVEGFLKKVEDNVDQIPQEIVIADPQTGQQLPRVLATPVIVLPITPNTEDEGKKKSASYSIRWLIEWSWKMMKMFSGKVVYRDESAEA